MKLAVDGRGLCAQPRSLDAQHWLALLVALQAADPSLEALLLAPEGRALNGVEGLSIERVPLPRGPARGVRYDQIALPRAAAQVGADLLLIPRACAPLRSAVPVAVFLPANVGWGPGAWASRVREAACWAGIAGASRLTWADISHLRDAHAVPPWVPAPLARGAEEQGGTMASPRVDRPYVMAVERQPRAWNLLLAAWTWVAGGVGDGTALRFCGLPSAAQEQVKARAAELGILDGLEFASPVSLSMWRQQMADASALLHSGEIAFGHALRWALAAGVPIACGETPGAEAIAGDAAYMVHPADARALGAACLTLLVEEDVAGDLRQRGLKRARAWQEGALIAMAEHLRRAAGLD